MSVTRTPTVDLNEDFIVDVPITKAYVDPSTGERFIIGVASGVRPDLDGERVSRRAIKGMAQKVQGGGVKLTSSHDQSWLTEMGDVVEATHDPKSDELIVKTKLEPEGKDPIADKAWLVANTRKVGFSVGGKLTSTYFERDDLGKKRKVLDGIDLRHIMLTEKPAYPHSFAQAVAKEHTGQPPADDEFTLDDDDVEKDMSTGSWASGDSDNSGGRDSVGSGQRNAGSRKPGSKGMDTEDDGEDDEPKPDLPKAPDERHLACPNCGHEFAADLPLDPEDRQPDSDDDADDGEPTDTGKSQETTRMSVLTDQLDALKALADGEPVTKEPEAPAEPDVAKTGDNETDMALGEVAKMLAASHKHNDERITSVEETVGKGFELIGKTLKDVKDAIGSIPQGRKSVARRLPPPVGHDDRQVSEDVEKQIEDAPDALSALKIQNEALYGIK